MELYLKPSEETIDFYTEHSFAYEGDSGLDLFFPKNIIVEARSTILVDLDICVEMRQMNNKFSLGEDSKLFTNKSMLLMPRSSIYKTPLRVANSIGLIDSNYRGNLKVPLDNISDKSYMIKRGEKLVQLVAPNLEDFKLVITSKLSKTGRENKGFGSSGK